jgi:FemAB-related protein (PEP-CTERM system-associated)
MRVLELQAQDKREWDEYVHDSPQACLFHLAGWKDVMEETFGLQSHYLLAKEGNQILGLLPLLQVKSRLSGHYFTSMPGAICTPDEEIAQALYGRAQELVTASGAQYLILRDSRHRWSLPGLATAEDHCTLVVKLHEDPEQIWMGVDRRVRQSTKKAIKSNVEVLSGPEHLQSLYPIYSRAMREMGTPTLGLAFFRNVLRQFPAHFTVMMVRHDRRVLGGGFVAYFKDTIYNTWGGMLRQYYDLRPNYILYWETLRYGCENGFQWVDLGRSAWDSCTYKFKKHWLSEPWPLYQQYYLNGVSQAPPVGGTREDDAHYRVFVKLWSRLPLSMTEFLGPRLRKRMPFG